MQFLTSYDKKKITTLHTETKEKESNIEEPRQRNISKRMKYVNE